jgi:hypothetical protein
MLKFYVIAGAALLTLFSIISSGCGSATTAINAALGSFTGSCSNFHDLSGNIFCIDYYGTTAAAIQSACTSQSVGTAGTYSSTACTTTGEVGNCNSSNLSSTVYTITHFFSPTTSSAAQTSCSSEKINGVSPTYTAG